MDTATAEACQLRNPAEAMRAAIAVMTPPLQSIANGLAAFRRSFEELTPEQREALVEGLPVASA